MAYLTNAKTFIALPALVHLLHKQSPCPSQEACKVQQLIAISRHRRRTTIFLGWKFHNCTWVNEYSGHTDVASAGNHITSNIFITQPWVLSGGGRGHDVALPMKVFLLFWMDKFPTELHTGRTNIAARIMPACKSPDPREL